MFTYSLINSKEIDAMRERSTKFNVSEEQAKNYNNALQYINLKDYVNAIKSLVKVLKLDKYNAKAQYALGFIYEFHVKNGHQNAVKWYTLASANGHSKADESILRVLAELNPKTTSTDNKKCKSI